MTTFVDGITVINAVWLNNVDAQVQVVPNCLRFDVAQVLTNPQKAQAQANIGLDTTSFTVLMATWFATLPTTLPASPGQPWNNGGTLSFS